MKYKIVICGCIKNGSKFIEDSLNKLISIGELDIIEDIKIVLYENDSKDNTVEIINDIIKKHDGLIHLISETNISKGNRTKCLAYGRNKLIEYVRCHFENYDLMLMTDLDYVLSRFENKIIDNVLRSYNYYEWDVLTANNYGLYYDIYALRTHANKFWKQSLFHDCWIKYHMDCSIYKNVQNSELLYRNIGIYQVNIDKDERLISVLSGFGGMGLYKIEKDKRLHV